MIAASGAAMAASAMVDHINGNLQAANTSKRAKYKVDCLNRANDTLRELKAHVEKWPFIRLTSLPGVEASIRALSHEFMETGVYEAAQKPQRRRKPSG